MRKRGQKFRDLPMAERFTQMEEAYARATVALTRARSVCIIFGPLDMKGLMGAAVAIQCPTSKPGMTLERFSWQACIRWARRSHRDTTKKKCHKRLRRRKLSGHWSRAFQFSLPVGRTVLVLVGNNLQKLGHWSMSKTVRLEQNLLCQLLQAIFSLIVRAALRKQKMPKVLKFAGRNGQIVPILCFAEFRLRRCVWIGSLPLVVSRCFCKINFFPQVLRALQIQSDSPMKMVMNLEEEKTGRWSKGWIWFDLRICSSTFWGFY